MVLGLLTKNSLASPWLDAGDNRLRHHIQVLSDNGILKTPITTWPIMWASIAKDINPHFTSTHSEQVQWSLEYVKFKYKQQQQPIKTKATLNFSNDTNPITQFGEQRREKNSRNIAVDWIGNNIAGRLNINTISNATDGDDFNLDGSYFAFLTHNWVITAGKYDRWWGPGWNSSSLLSSNARPIPTLAIQRNATSAIETNGLKWLGDWQFNAFLSELEKQRHIANAKMIGTRLSSKPLNLFEVSLSQTELTGGNQDPNTNADIKKSNYRLSSIDLRLPFILASTNNALYWQQSKQASDSGSLLLGGIESSFIINKSQRRLVLEATDTQLNQLNTGYEHDYYQTGYRYKQRAIGITTDNDSTSLSFSGQHYFSNGHQLHWSIHKLDINQDQTNLALPSGNGFTETESSTYAQISYARPINKKWYAKLGISLINKDIKYLNDQMHDSIFLNLTYKP